MLLLSGDHEERWPRSSEYKARRPSTRQVDGVYVTIGCCSALDPSDGSRDRWQLGRRRTGLGGNVVGKLYANVERTHRRGAQTEVNESDGWPRPTARASRGYSRARDNRLVAADEQGLHEPITVICCALAAASVKGEARFP